MIMRRRGRYSISTTQVVFLICLIIIISTFVNVLRILVATNEEDKSFKMCLSTLPQRRDYNYHAYKMLNDKDKYLEVLPFDHLLMDKTKSKPMPTAYNLTYTKALEMWSTKKKEILLVYIDEQLVDMAYNFVEFSIISSGINNLLMIADSKVTCVTVEYGGIPCYVVKSSISGLNRHPENGRTSFSEKHSMNDVIFDAINLGYTVLYSDVNTVYYINPFRFIDPNKAFDIALIWENSVYSPGLLYIKPSSGSKWLFSAMRSHNTAHKPTSQVNINARIKEGQKKGIIIVEVLNKKLFRWGKSYFEEGRNFAGQNPCYDCLVIHNNWICTHAAKVYRLKENHMWVNDVEQYYTSTFRKYLTYSNNLFGLNLDYHTREQNSLKMALKLGKILNRIVILPKFHCGNSTEANCSLLSGTYIQNMDKYFKNKYRENTFLQHPKVPSIIKNSIPMKCLITTKAQHGMAPKNSHKISIKFYKDNSLTDVEILQQLGHINTPVVEFSSLDDINVYFQSSKIEADFNIIADKAVTKSSYRQCRQ